MTAGKGKKLKTANLSSKRWSPGRLSKLPNAKLDSACWDTFRWRPSKKAKAGALKKQ